jgi:hypothetical protein
MFNMTNVKNSVFKVKTMIKEEVKNFKTKKTIEDSKIFRDAAVNTDVTMEDIFEVIDIQRNTRLREWVKGYGAGYATALGGLAIGVMIGKVINK